MTFYNQFQQLQWQQCLADIYAKTAPDVERALGKRRQGSLDDFMALISPAALPYLEEMAGLSQKLTQKRFGKTVQMYIPLYLSNKCSNGCRYCGFNSGNQFERMVLTDEQILAEVEAIKEMGYEHVLLVSGEARETGIEYLKHAIELVSPHFANISMEVPPMDQADYEALVSMGLYAVLIYQETYGPKYDYYHPRGKKKDFKYRLLTPDRLGAAGIHKIGLGTLIGLDDWRTDAFFTALHLDYLEKTYWRTKFSISFPRIRPASGSLPPAVVMSDEELVQLICAYRIFNENVELSISTRETRSFRDHVFLLGITSMSAGSKTNPGGYSATEDSTDQFQVDDDRSPAEITSLIQSKGFEPVWKDWFGENLPATQQTGI